MPSERSAQISATPLWFLRAGLVLATCSGALACMDYEVGFNKELDQHYLEDSAVPVEPPPDDSALPLLEANPLEFEDPPEDDPPEDDPPQDDPPEPAVGCSDGTREGYLDIDAYPDIAACSGGWTVGGVTRSDLAPTCSHGSGDDSWNTEGDGCSAADLCAEGWHVCEGHGEVGAKAGSCDDAVPYGSPDKSLLFAVQQHSDNGSVCNDSSPNGNDIFGCGNLGTDLSSDKGCGVLNKVIASMNAGSCGYNEAEPSHGPWECFGDTDSHYHEGELVTKKGCWGSSCSYDGNPVGNSDKGGVLCCRD
jgi:hypothetical protein